MRKEIAKALRTMFRVQMASELGNFIVLEDKNSLKGCDLFQWKISPAISAFIMLQLHRYEDTYFVEIGLSQLHRWPANMLPDVPKDYLVGGEARARLTRFWQPVGSDSGWQLDGPAESSIIRLDQEPLPIDSVLQRIPESVTQAVAAIKMWGIPYIVRFGSC